jgi:hypothetical protein
VSREPDPKPVSSTVWRPDEGVEVPVGWKLWFHGFEG